MNVNGIVPDNGISPNARHEFRLRDQHTGSFEQNVQNVTLDRPELDGIALVEKRNARGIKRKSAERVGRLHRDRLPGIKLKNLNQDGRSGTCQGLERTSGSPALPNG